MKWFKRKSKKQSLKDKAWEEWADKWLTQDACQDPYTRDMSATYDQYDERFDPEVRGYEEEED